MRREADREWGVRNPGMEKLLTWEEFRENTYSFLNSAGMASNRLKDMLFCHKIFSLFFCDSRSFYVEKNLAKILVL